MKAVGLIDSKDRLITFNAFKNITAVRRYRLDFHIEKVLFIGHPRKNLWGVYLDSKQHDADYLKEAYKVFQTTFKGDLSFMDKAPGYVTTLQWGNAGIPLVYADLKTVAYKNAELHEP